jgi:nitrous oxidase accessory protein NosD
MRMRNVAIRTAVAAVALAAVIGMGAIPASASGAGRHRVEVPLGHSIQKAINEAPPGTTIVLEPGVYKESVMIRKDEITLQGAGPGEDGTILMPPDKLPANACRQFAKGSGVCVLATHVKHGQITKTADNDVVTGITFDGGWNFGVFAFGTTGLKIINNEAENFHEYGFARFESSGGLIEGNEAFGLLPDAEAGVYLGDSPDAHAIIRNNSSSGSTFGVFVRHSHFVEVSTNDVDSNCQGIMILDDGQPGGVGDINVHDNKVHANNADCPGEPPLAGGGILLLGASNSNVWRNLVLSNSGDQVNSGGILLLSSAPFTGGADPVGNRIHDNSAYQNAPADIIYDGSGSGNTFSRNHCDTSQPSGLCT